jgi:putative endonuclease
MPDTVWHLYLLRCADGTFYAGVTTDLDRRLAEHNGDRPGGARYTRTRRPVTLARAHPCDGRAQACRLEARLKRLDRAAKQQWAAERQELEG